MMTRLCHNGDGSARLGFCETGYRKTGYRYDLLLLYVVRPIDLWPVELPHSLWPMLRSSFRPFIGTIARALRPDAPGGAAKAKALHSLRSLLDKHPVLPGGVLRLECAGEADIRVSPGDHESVSISYQAEGGANGVAVHVEQQQQRQLIGVLQLCLKAAPHGPA
jgi:hypothetical protein